MTRLSVVRVAISALLVAALIAVAGPALAVERAPAGSVMAAPAGVVTIVDTLAGVDTATLFEMPGSGGQVIHESQFVGPQFALATRTQITEIGAFLRGGPFVVQIRPEKNGAPDPDVTLATIPGPDGNDSLHYSFEKVATDLVLPAGTYYALFAPAEPQGLGILLGLATIPFDYQGDRGLLGILRPNEWSANSVLSFAARVLGRPVDEPQSPACGATITSSVRLDADIATCLGDGLIVNAHGSIDIDLAGHTIYGSGVGTGVRVTYDPNHPATVIVRNGTIEGFNDGVAVNRADAVPGVPRPTVTFSDLRIVRNRRSAVVNPESAATTVIDSYIAKNEYAFNNTEPLGCLSLGLINVVHNWIILNDLGGTFGACTGAVVGAFVNNEIAYNTHGGVTFLELAGPSTITGNEFWYNGGDAVEFRTNCARSFAGNTIIGNPGVGLLLDGGPTPPGDCKVENNEIWGNSVGISMRIEGGSEPLTRTFEVTKNTITSNAVAGINVNSSAAPTLIAGNTLARNGWLSWLNPVRDEGGVPIHDGIHALGGGITISDNHSRENGGYGIAAFDNAADGGGNVAFRNGQPAECLGVKCYTPPPSEW